MLENPIWKLCCVAVVFLMDIVHSGMCIVTNIGYKILDLTSCLGQASKVCFKIIESLGMI